MDVLKIVNEHVNKRRFGMIVRLLRYRSRHTLRSLAEQVNFSHAHLRKIELGETPITRRIFDYLMSNLNLELVYDEAREKDFYERSEKLHQDIIFLDKDGADATLKSLEDSHDYHANALWLVDYYLTLFCYYSTLFAPDAQKLSFLNNELGAIENLMDDKQRQRYLIYRGNYFYHMGDLKRSKEAFEMADDINPSDHFAALTKYLLGLTYANTFQRQRSNRLLKEAMTMFERQGNDMRVVASHLFMAMNNMVMGHEKGVDQAYEDGVDFTRQYGLSILEKRLHYAYAIFNMKKKKFARAVEILDRISDKEPRHFFYRAYSYLGMGDKKQVEAILHQKDKMSTSNKPKELIYDYGLRFIECHMENDEKAYSETLRSFYREALHNEAYFEIDIAYLNYRDYLVSKRRYKDVYDLTKTMIDLTKKAYN